MKTKLLLLILIIAKFSFSQCSIDIIDNQYGCIDSCQASASVYNEIGTEPFEYLWSNEQTTYTATGLCADSTYYLILTDANDCVDTAYITMRSALTVDILSITDASCIDCCDGAIEFITGEIGCTAPYYYHILDLDNNLVTDWGFDDLCSGSYQACIRDQCDCQRCVPFNIGTISENNLNNSFSISNFYPNPADNKITIQTSEKQYEIVLINLSGKILLKEKNTKVIDLGNYPPGKYIVRLIGQKTTEEQSIIVY
jgi:hypothetical protein